MEKYFAIIVGVICIAIGISQRMGNLSMLHSYHKNRVSEEDMVPFGKMVGLGTIILGVALLIRGILTYLAITLQASVYSRVGTIVLIIGMVAGLGISFYAMKKYNKGVF